VFEEAKLQVPIEYIAAYADYRRDILAKPALGLIDPAEGADSFAHAPVAKGIRISAYEIEFVQGMNDGDVAFRSGSPAIDAKAKHAMSIHDVGLKTPDKIANAPQEYGIPVSEELVSIADRGRVSFPILKPIEITVPNAVDENTILSAGRPAFTRESSDRNLVAAPCLFLSQDRNKAFCSAGSVRGIERIQVENSHDSS